MKSSRPVNSDVRRLPVSKVGLNEMDQTQKVISRFPVEELWAGQRLVSTIKVRDLDASDIADLVRSNVVRFVVADVGKPYEWIPNNERFDFWKDEVKAHLADPKSRAFLEDFPSKYCYFASEWKSYDGNTIILLSKAH
jgi:hypothetical protein